MGGAPKQKWTAEEEEALEAGVKKHGTGKWKKILKDPEFGLCLATRSNIDLKDKWRNMHCRKVEAAALEEFPKNMGKRPWTATEDRILSDYIKTHGEGGWSNLPTKAGIKRCGKACCNRWFNYLRSDIKRGNISSVEQELIIRLHKLFGNRWSLIARILSGRTANEIQNYWEAYLAKKIQDHSTSSSTRKSCIKSKEKRRTVTITPVETRSQSQIVESRDKNSGSTDRCKEMDLESGCPLRGRNLQNNEMDCNHVENCFLSEFPPLWKTDDFLSPNSDDPLLYLDEMLQNWTGDDGLSDIDIDTLINALGSEEDWLEE